MDEDQATKQHGTTPQDIIDSDDLLVARLKQLLVMPGVSDKDRKQVERNLGRLLKVQELRKKQGKGLTLD